MSDYPEPTSFTGDDERELAGGLASPERLFWKAYAFAVRTNCVGELLSIYRPMASFRDLVAEAERREARRLRGAA
jgi:hypothetical protein